MCEICTKGPELMNGKYTRESDDVQRSKLVTSLRGANAEICPLWADRSAREEYSAKMYAPLYAICPIHLVPRNRNCCITPSHTFVTLPYRYMHLRTEVLQSPVFLQTRGAATFIIWMSQCAAYSVSGQTAIGRRRWSQTLAYM